MGQPESRDAVHITTVRFPQATYDLLEVLAHDRHRSVGGEIRAAVDAWIESAGRTPAKRKRKPPAAADGALAR